MRESIKKELTAHVQSLIDDGVLNEENKEDWHHHAFNEDYYIVGYWNATEWLRKHDVGAFEAIEDVQEYERDNLGETSTPLNPESIVNMYVYIFGEGIINDFMG